MRRLVLIGAGLVLVTALLGAGAWWWTRPQPVPWPIVIQRPDGNLVLVDDAGHEQPLTTGGDGRSLMYLYPTPSPDGRSVALVAVRQSSSQLSAALLVVDVEGERSTLFDQAGQVPFYLSWAPDSRRIAFLVGSSSGMALHTAALGGDAHATRVAEGQPSYFSWSPDSKRLLLHIGGEAPAGRLALYDWGTDEPRPVEAQPALFNAPSWLPDGKSAIVMLRQEDQTALATIDREGRVLQRLINVAPGTRFVRAPDGQRLAYLQPGIDPLGELHVLKGTDDRAVERSAVTAVWSPRGDMLAFLTLVERNTPAGQPPLLRWNVFSVADGAARKLAEFRPTAQFMELLPFFDQYAQSHRLWDHDGNRLLYATADGVYTLDVRSGATRRIGAGVLGLWME